MLFEILPLFYSAVSAAAVERQTLSGSTICQQIAGSISGDVYYPLSLGTNFVNDTAHHMTSSDETPLCVVEVDGPEDVSSVIRLVGATRTPFAVKSGGHASNPGFSSTTGVFISLVRLNQVTLSADKATVEIGLGNIWSDVYAVLDGSGYNVVGGRVPGPGTGGFTLGGGYSWKTDQYGLTCDTVVSYNLVLPNGTITVVDAEEADLYFALKGGLNRFGVVTSIVYNTVPQVDLVYGGDQIFSADKIPALTAATKTFQETNTDPKAQVILTINGGTAPNAILLGFYDGPSRPSAFDPYNDIIPLVDGFKTQSFKSFIASTPSDLSAGSRGAFATLSTNGLTQGFLDAIHNESIYYGTLAALNTGILLSYDVEPFLNYGQYATDSAYPHADSPLPLNLYFSWELEVDDSFWRGAIQQSIDTLTNVAKAEGIFSEDLYAYPNYALDTYTGAQLYGPTNAARLRAIQAAYDPAEVMLLAGGFSF